MPDGTAPTTAAAATAQDDRRRIGVRIDELPAPAAAEPLAAYLALRDAFGVDNVYLLESLSGPAKDSQSAMVGFNPLLTIEIRRGAGGASIEGHAALREHVVAAAVAAGALTARDGGYAIDERDGLWRLLRAVQDGFAVDHPDPGGAYAFGFFGYFGYDVAHFVEELPYRIADTSGVPDVCLVLFQGVVRFDVAHGDARIVCADAGLWPSLPPERIAALLEAAEPAAPPPLAGSDVPPVPAPRAVRDTIERERYLKNVRRALHHISIGDIYQVQLGHDLVVETDAAPFDVYRRLRARNPSPYMYLARLGETAVVGASPELFLRIERGVLTMRPLAGTIRRGRDEAEDAAAQAKLRSDEKEVAEHVMLVDLCRNDIGRVCEPKTLDVDELLVTERYSHVFHLVSNVTGRAAAGTDAYDAIAASFPAGTMTGAPKIRAMEIIEDLETTRRGIYSGAIGVIDFSGYVNLALCIRTAVRHGGRYFIRASAGAVADSIPEQEWKETMAKMGATYWAVAGEELAP
ncbi:MAG TPA: anthranilate synthase component I family protein [Stellaceae bacterium]